MKKFIYICPICGTPSDDDWVECSVCGWEISGDEGSFTEEEKNDPHWTSNSPVSVNVARKLFAEGKDMWGDPIDKDLWQKTVERNKRNNWKG